MLLPTRNSKRENFDSSGSKSDGHSEEQYPKAPPPTKISRYTKAISLLQVLTLAVILIAVLRILLWPTKPLSADEMKFLGWALGTLVTMLFAGNALGRKL